jgi:hypothetical protein
VSGPRRTTYRFGPVERRGLLGPVRVGQALVVGGAALAAVGLIDVSSSLGGLLPAVLLLGVAVAAIAAPVAGRTADAWAPISVAYLLRRLHQRGGFRSSTPTEGARFLPLKGGLSSPTPLPPPGLEAVQIVELQHGGRRVGALAERSGRRLTIVLACRVVSFALLDAEAQERRLARWGQVLASLAGSPVHRLQWLERTAPAQGDELARWLHEARDPALPLRGTPMVESYLELISSTTRAAHEHEILVAAQVDSSRLFGRPLDELEAVAVEQAERIARGLEAAEVKVLGLLTHAQLTRCLRTAFDPFSAAELTTLAAHLPNDAGTTIAWPLAHREAWEHLRCDGALHATHWVAGWPRAEVAPMFMDALLGTSRAVRTVSVCFEPVAPERSTREVEAAITRDRADRELRHRFGQSETARHRQAQEAALRREAELAAGHTEVRLAGFVTASGRDEQELRHATADVLEQAARSRLELRRLYGQQAEAFTFTLPLARGLR